MQKHLAINLNAQPDTQDQAITVSEAFARLAAGLSLDGIQISLSYTTFETDDEDD